MSDRYLEATPILDYQDLSLKEGLLHLKGHSDTSQFLYAAFLFIQKHVKPVYTLDELQPASLTLKKGKGSCSQRMALLEALARANGIKTRVRGLWIKGDFWTPRFPAIRPFLPNEILLAWPQFYVSQDWVDFDELFHSTEEIVSQGGQKFTNQDMTMFEAVAVTSVDFMGKSRRCQLGCINSAVDLSGFIVRDEGFFDSRDALYSAFPLLQNSLQGKVFELVFGGRESIST